MEVSTKEYYSFIDNIKTIAAFLIVNSHFDSLYPIKNFATGGAIGNALFFASSGFLLYPISKNFFKWIIPKILKLYIPTILMIIISLFTIKTGYFSENGFVKTFIWPTPYWFIGAIILFYILYAIFIKVTSIVHYIIFLTLVIYIYILYYSRLDTSYWCIESNGLDSKEGFFKLIYYFVAMMIGKWYRINSEKKYRHTRTYAVGVFLSFSSIYALKYLMNLNNELFHLQFINHLSILFLVFFVFRLCLSLKEKIKEISFTRKFIKFVGKHTLEMYLTQFVVIFYCQDIFFPLNIVIAILLIIILSSFLKIISSRLLNIFTI